MPGSLSFTILSTTGPNGFRDERVFHGDPTAVHGPDYRRNGMQSRSGANFGRPTREFEAGPSNYPERIPDRPRAMDSRNREHEVTTHLASPVSSPSPSARGRGSQRDTHARQVSPSLAPEPTEVLRREKEILPVEYLEPEPTLSFSDSPQHRRPSSPTSNRASSFQEEYWEDTYEDPPPRESPPQESPPQESSPLPLAMRIGPVDCSPCR